MKFELSRTLGTLPPKVLVFGIEARNLAVGVGLSPEVEVNLPVLVQEVLAASLHVEIGVPERDTSWERWWPHDSQNDICHDRG